MVEGEEGEPCSSRIGRARIKGWEEDRKERVKSVQERIKSVRERLEHSTEGRGQRKKHKMEDKEEKKIRRKRKGQTRMKTQDKDQKQ